MSDIDLDVAKEFSDKIETLVKSQVEDNKEAIFFIYDDLTTSDIYQGEATHISLSRDQEARIMNQGEIVGSVHTHPSGFDPSTIDIMTGLATTQRYMSVVTPVFDDDVDGDYVLTTMDLSDLSFGQRFRLMKAMRRSSTGLTELGRQIRKELNLQRFGVSGYRTHKIDVDGISVPLYDRPSIFNVDVGDQTTVSNVDGMEQYIGD